MLGFVRQAGDNVVLVVVNLGERTFSDYGYGVRTGGRDGQWTQMLCSAGRGVRRLGRGRQRLPPALDAGRRDGVHKCPEVSVVMFRRT